MFTTFLVQPIYNAFVFLLGYMPQGDAGLAIIALTVITRIVLYPVFVSSIRTQMGMSAMQAELEVVEKKFKDDKEALGRERIALLRKHKVNPLSTIVSLVIQFGLIIALSVAVFREGFPTINHELLYSFVHAPAMVSTTLFGLIDLLTPHHVVLAVLVGAAQYWAIHLTLARTPAQGTGDKAAAMRMQQNVMRFMMPVLIAGMSYFFSAAFGLYFLASNLISVVQEWLIRRHVL